MVEYEHFPRKNACELTNFPWVHYTLVQTPTCQRGEWVSDTSGNTESTTKWHVLTASTESDESQAANSQRSNPVKTDASLLHRWLQMDGEKRKTRQICSSTYISIHAIIQKHLNKWRGNNTAMGICLSSKIIYCLLTPETTPSSQKPMWRHRYNLGSNRNNICKMSKQLVFM